MCHILIASAFLRCSVIKFRHHDVHVKSWKVRCRALPLLSHHVASSRADPPFRNSSSRIPGLTRDYVSCKLVHVGIFLPHVVYVGFKSFRSSSGQSKYGTACAFEGFGGGDALSSDAEDDEEEEEEEEAAGQECIVVNFYHLVEVEDPHQEVARHTAFMEGRDLRGRIYINHQGINAQLSGPVTDAMAYADWVKMDERFSPMYIQVSPSPHGHVFPRLKLRFKPSLVQVCGTASLPLTDPSSRAVPLTPQQWREKLEARASLDVRDKKFAVNSDADLQNMEKVLVLDVRNGYEWDVGHFQGAQRPEVECFKNTEFGLSDEKNTENDPLAGVDKENVDVMMYCTGGIRCDVYSTMLRQKGFKNLYTLKGGVAKYLKEEGSTQWNGRLFVFDSRLSVPSVFYHGGEISEDKQKIKDELSGKSSIARCLLCGESVEALHRNCANLDCNKLYLSCPDCVGHYRGCCCNECIEAPRLRPLLNPEETYRRWHNYRDPPPPPPRPPGWISRRALKRRNRKERRRQAELASGPKSNTVTAMASFLDENTTLEMASSLAHQPQQIVEMKLNIAPDS